MGKNANKKWAKRHAAATVVDPEWTPLQRAYYPPEELRRAGLTEAPTCYRNSRYQVVWRDVAATAERPALVHLSIKRNDRQPIHDWRDLQRIKNELCGVEREALEIYPAESRLVDEANQFHLWVLPEGVRVPFGFADRLVSETSVNGSVQRPFETVFGEKNTSIAVGMREI